MTPQEAARLINASMDRHREQFEDEGPMAAYNAMADLLVSAGIVDCSVVELLQLTDGAYKEDSKALAELRSRSAAPRA